MNNVIEEYKSRTFRLANIGTWVFDVVNDELHWSPFIKELHEVQSDYQPKLKEAINFYAEEDRSIITKAVEEAVANGEPFAVELKIITAKGNERWVRAVGETEVREGECVRVFGSTQDIDQRVKAEQKLRDIVEHTTNMFYTHTADHLLTYVSPQSKEFLGYTPEESMAKWIEFATDHPINQKGYEVTQRAIKTGKAQPPHELQLKKKDGEIIWVRVNEAPVTKNGKTDKVVGSLTDITAQKRHEEKLKELSLVASKTTDKILILNPEGEVVWVNRAFEEQSGYSLEECVGKNIDGLLQGPHTDMGTVQRLREAMRKRQSVQDVILNYAKDGTPYWVDITVDPVFDDNGQCTKMVEVQKDVTEKVEQEQKIINALKEKETLLAEVHHRVKNNLAVVAGMLQLQAFEMEDQTLVNKFLDSVSRIGAMAEIHEQLYQSNSFSKVNFSDNLQRLGTKIQNTIPSVIPVELSFHLEALELNVNQAIPCSLIVNEVVTNCLKHAFGENEQGYITFFLSEKEGYISLSVADNGRGLPEDFMTENREKSLGLNLIDTLAKQLEADYHYGSNGDGTIFSMKFKRAELKGIGSNIIAQQ